MELHGITVLVTGANRGIGRAIAQRLAREPVRVLAGVRDVSAYDPIPAGQGTVVPVALDLSSRESIDAGLDGLGDDLRAIDVLVNNAGQFTAGLLEEQDLEQIYSLIQVNLLGTIHLTHRLLPIMLARGSGKIVNNSSVSGYVNFPAVSTYAASKGGVAAFTESLRRELAPTPVTTLHVITGGIATEMLDDTKRLLEPHFGTLDGWDRQSPESWADKIARAIAADDDVLGPGGKSALGKLASHLPKVVLDTVSSRSFRR
ncbi:SDR family NAD(P)-dependent oxidoreductase [Baekduia soli]|uniref:SDR family NAD(P)-dependent oxidoreductase n=1 Tax=Baekduia soli TaxID=496014 RepID=A0A5B8U2C5_9ACTN|nr:SDR family NAD(P)-dependent oxidoreductase [Baekduia soli]QEC47194.1 SDR family NAD(P)-dependent oxidoreductase [Baekduia soli]